MMSVLYLCPTCSALGENKQPPCECVTREPPALDGARTRCARAYILVHLDGLAPYADVRLRRDFIERYALGDVVAAAEHYGVDA
jgi:hypothetical protein